MSGPPMMLEPRNWNRALTFFSDGTVADRRRPDLTAESEHLDGEIWPPRS
jgi:hypothetical protein